VAVWLFGHYPQVRRSLEGRSPSENNLPLIKGKGINPVRNFNGVKGMGYQTTLFLDG